MGIFQICQVNLDIWGDNEKCKNCKYYDINYILDQKFKFESEHHCCEHPKLMKFVNKFNRNFIGIEIFKESKGCIHWEEKR